MNRRIVLKAGLSLVALPLVPGALALAPRVAEACDKHKAAGKAAAGAGGCERVVAKVGRNHGHVLQVSLDDVRAGVEKTYDIAGTSTHAHTATVTAEDFKRIRDGEVFRVASSRDGGHAHRLLVKCAPVVDPPEAANVCEILVAGKDEHEFAITAADVAAKADKTYDIQGISGHGHTLLVTADDWAKLAKGEQLAITCSQGAGHAHVVYIRYPAKGAGGKA